MDDKVLCPFCSEDVTENISPGSLLTCPRCDAHLLLTADEVGGEERVRTAVGEEQNIPPDRVKVVIHKGVSTQGGGPLHLIAGWNPDEMLLVRDAVRILGVSRWRVWQHIQEGKFPHASRRQPSRPEYKTGMWQIPRNDVYLLLRGRGRETKGGSDMPWGMEH